MDDPAAILPRFMLDDGRTICVRRLRASDRAKYEAAVAGLSPRSRYLRFAAPITSISGPLLDQMMCVDDARHVVYAALTPDETTIVGVARFVAGDAPGVAEVAIAIADDWQGHGLGFELLEWVVEHARDAGLERLIATALSENRGAGRLARAIGFSVASRAGIYTEYDMPLGHGPPKTGASGRPLLNRRTRAIRIGVVAAEGSALDSSGNPLSTNDQRPREGGAALAAPPARTQPTNE